jgi:hypothetical protein
MSVLVEKIHARPGVPVRPYQLRGNGAVWKEKRLTHLICEGFNDPAPAPVISMGDADAEMQLLTSKKLRSDSQFGLTHHFRWLNVSQMSTFELSEDFRHLRLPLDLTVFRLLMRLDEIVNPGLTEEQFYGLFARCDRCGLITTRRAFQSHSCVMAEKRTDFRDVWMVSP